MIGFLAFLNCIGLIYLFIVVHDLKEQMKRSRPSPLPPAFDQQQKASAMQVPIYTPSAEDKIASDSLQRFFSWFAHEWPLKVGALFVLFGFVWLVRYAFLHNWIGEAGRIVLGLLAGSAIFMTGASRMKKNLLQGEIVTALGAGVVLVTIYAAQYAFSDKLFPPTIALVFAMAVTAAVSYVSFVHNTRRLAILGLIIGSAAPLLTNTESKSILGLFTYLLVLNAATLWLVRLTGWRILTLISLAMVWLYSIPYLSIDSTPSNMLYMRFFAVTFTVLYYLTSLSAFLYDEQGKNEDTVVGLMVGLYSLQWITAIIPEEWRSVVSVGFAVLFMLGAQSVFKIRGIARPVYVYTLVATIFLIAATFIEFEGRMLAAVLATEAVGLLIYSDLVYGKQMVRYVSFLFILSLFTGTSLLIDFQYTPGHQLTVIYLIAALGVGGIYLLHYAKQPDEQLQKIGKLLMVAAGIFTLFYIWILVPYLTGYHSSPLYIQNYRYTIYDDVEFNGRLFIARAITLMIYAFVGIGMYVYGMHEKHFWTRRFGFFLTCFVIARILLVDVWDMSLGPRIATFFIVGAILMSSVFIRKRSHEPS